MKTLQPPRFVCFQFSTYFPGYFDGQYWLWWVFLVLGKYSKFLDVSSFSWIRTPFLSIFPLFRLLVIPARFHQLCQNPQDGRHHVHAAPHSSPLYLLNSPFRVIQSEEGKQRRFWTKPWCEMVNGNCKKKKKNNSLISSDGLSGIIHISKACGV